MFSTLDIICEIHTFKISLLKDHGVSLRTIPEIVELNVWGLWSIIFDAVFFIRIVCKTCLERTHVFKQIEMFIK